MSLIDGLIDELNKSADEWNESNMFELARMCRNAAYTILELQNDAELLRAIWSQERTEKRCYMSENAKLREQIHWLKQGDILHVLTDQEYIDQCERESLMQVSIDALDKENAKLRELLHEALLFGDEKSYQEIGYRLKQQARELGVEVNDG